MNIIQGNIAKFAFSIALASGAPSFASASADTVGVTPACNNEQICELGVAAENAFFEGWATGGWEEFRSMLNTDDVVFQFPDGPFKGRSYGQEGYKNINLWIDHHIEMKNRIHHSERDIQFGVDDWYYFADEAEGHFYGKDYEGSHMIGFRFRNGKIVEYREYVGDLTHWK